MNFAKISEQNQITNLARVPNFVKIAKLQSKINISCTFTENLETKSEYCRNFAPYFPSLKFFLLFLPNLQISE